MSKPETCQIVSRNEGGLVDRFSSARNKGLPGDLLPFRGMNFVQRARRSEYFSIPIIKLNFIEPLKQDS